MNNKPKIGFIGQGWIGKNYSDDFEKRGYEVIRYALEEPYVQNKAKLSEAEIVFVAVPTPTTPKGFDDSILRAALKNTHKGQTVVIKSTLKPGTTKMLQKACKGIYLMHAPEFLSRGTASHDAQHPIQNIIGIPVDTAEYRTRAEAVLPASRPVIVPSTTAEFFKYVHNTSLFARGMYMNMLYDLAQPLRVDWKDIKDMIIHDPMIAFQDPEVGKWHIEPAHPSGRGIGGDCHIKDFETFERLFREYVDDPHSMKMIRAMKERNIKLLLDHNKDFHFLEMVYGKGILKKAVKSSSAKATAGKGNSAKKAVSTKTKTVRK
jgi:UDPglucose 6-dehydrogenase